MKTIKVLGPGCDNCKQLEANAREAVMMAGVEAEIDDGLLQEGGGIADIQHAVLSRLKRREDHPITGLQHLEELHHAAADRVLDVRADPLGATTTHRVPLVPPDGRLGDLVVPRMARAADLADARSARAGNLGALPLACRLDVTVVDGEGRPMSDAYLRVRARRDRMNRRARLFIPPGDASERASDRASDRASERASDRSSERASER